MNQLRKVSIYLICEPGLLGADGPFVELLHRVWAAPATTVLQVNVWDSDGMADGN